MTSLINAADNDDIAPENAEPPNKKASKLESRENTAFLKTVLHWKKRLHYDVYQDDLQKHLHKSDYFGVYCDGSTDRSKREKALVMVRVIEDFYLV